jgi:hypothetical protein
MQDQDTKKATPEQKIVRQAYTWCDADKARLGDKKNPELQRLEYRERRTLAKIIDDARGN